MKVVSSHFVRNTSAVIVQKVSVLMAMLCGSAELHLFPVAGVLVNALDLTYIPHCWQNQANGNFPL